MTIPNSVKNLSCNLQQISSALKDVLEETADTEVNFILLVACDNTIHYISILERQQSISLLKDLQTRWEQNKSDIPAHYNPDLIKP